MQPPSGICQPRTAVRVHIQWPVSSSGAQVRSSVACFRTTFLRGASPGLLQAGLTRMDPATRAELAVSAMLGWCCPGSGLAVANACKPAARVGFRLQSDMRLSL